MIRKNAVWTDEDDQRLRQAVDAGVSAARAAVIFKRSIHGVRNRACKIGKPFPGLHAVKRSRDAKIEAAARELRYP